MEKENSKDKKINDVQEEKKQKDKKINDVQEEKKQKEKNVLYTDNINTNDSKNSKEKLEPKRIKIPLICVILGLIILLTGITVGTLIFLQSYLHQ